MIDPLLEQVYSVRTRLAVVVQGTRQFKHLEELRALLSELDSVIVGLRKSPIRVSLLVKSQQEKILEENKKFNSAPDDFQSRETRRLKAVAWDEILKTIEKQEGLSV